MSKATCSKAAEGQPFSEKAGERGTRAVWRDGHWRAVRPRSRRPGEGCRREREQPWEASPRPAGVASARAGEPVQPAERPRPPTPGSLPAEDAAARTPGPGLPDGPPCLAVQGRLSGRSGSPWTWKVRRDGRTRRGGDTVRPPGAQRQRGRRDLDSLPKAKGSLPRDPSEVQNKSAILAAA